MPCIGFLESSPVFLHAGHLAGIRLPWERAECRHFVLFQRHTCRWRSLLHRRCACTMPSCPLASAEGESDMLWAGWKFPRADIFLSPLVTGLVTWKMWVRKSCVWGKKERESGRPSARRAHAVIREGENLVRSGLHYPASGVGEAGYPFGSRRLFSCCFLVWIWLKLGKVVIVLGIHRGQGAPRELASQTPSWGSSGDWRRSFLVLLGCDNRAAGYRGKWTLRPTP